MTEGKLLEWVSLNQIEIWYIDWKGTHSLPLSFLFPFIQIFQIHQPARHSNDSIALLSTDWWLFWWLLNCCWLFPTYGDCQLRFIDDCVLKEESKYKSSVWVMSTLSRNVPEATDTQVCVRKMNENQVDDDQRSKIATDKDSMLQNILNWNLRDEINSHQVRCCHSEPALSSESEANIRNNGGLVSGDD